MANEEVKVDVEETEVDTPEEELNDTTDWQAEAKKARGIAARLRTKLTKATEAKKPDATPVETKTKNGFDYAEKAYLKASGVQTDEYDLILEAMHSTGKALDDVLESKWFQAELKDLRDTKASKEAVPSGTKRSGSPTSDSVEYWIRKGQLPPADQVELRRKVVNARIKTEEDKSRFTSNPVV